MHKRKQLNNHERALVALYATHLMGWQRNLTKRAKKRIVLAACTLACYDLGFEKVVGIHSLENWFKKIEESVRVTNARRAIKSGRAGRTAYTDHITAAHPNYLHEMFRTATQLVGDDATFDLLARTMNLQSAALENMPTLTLDKFKLYRWFHKNKGKERKTVERPLLMEEHKQARLHHVQLIQTLTQQGRTIIYLDEKWFYCFLRRKKQKHLPRAPFDPEGADRMRIRRIISRRYPVKTMFMGVITTPQEQHNFNGLVTIKRLSRQERLQRGTHRFRFHIDL